MTPRQRAALYRAAHRPGGHVLPINRLWGAAAETLLQHLQAQGWATIGPMPAITDAGRALVQSPRDSSPATAGDKR